MKNSTKRTLWTAAILVSMIQAGAAALTVAAACPDSRQYSPPGNYVDESVSIIRLASAGDTENVRRLLDAGISPDTPSKYGYFTALQIAAASGNVELAALLLDAGADPNLISGSDANNGRCKGTALFWAAHQGHVEMVKFLLDHGADPKVHNKQRATALKWADIHGHFEVVIILAEAMEGTAQ